jgi:hypothetical protein
MLRLTPPLRLGLCSTAQHPCTAPITASRRCPLPRRTLNRAVCTATATPEAEDLVTDSDEPCHVILTPEFLNCANDLRAVFDERCAPPLRTFTFSPFLQPLTQRVVWRSFNDPRDTHPERFLWDYWYDPGRPSSPNPTRVEWRTERWTA